MKDNTDPLSLHRQVATTAAAEFLGIVPRTLEKFRQVGGGPPYVRISAKCVRYRISDLLAWQASKMRENTGDNPEPPRRRRGDARIHSRQDAA